MPSVSPIQNLFHRRLMQLIVEMLKKFFAVVHENATPSSLNALENVVAKLMIRCNVFDVNTFCLREPSNLIPQRYIFFQFIAKISFPVKMIVCGACSLVLVRYAQPYRQPYQSQSRQGVGIINRNT